MNAWMAGLRSAKMAVMGLLLAAAGIASTLAVAGDTYGPYYVVLGLDQRVAKLAQQTDNASVLVHDRWMILFYGLTLMGFALFFRARASSHFGCLLANLVIVASTVAFGASAVENALLTEWIRRGSDWSGWLTAIATAATIAFCALVVAALGIPAAVGIALRGIAGALRAHRWRVNMLAKPRPRWLTAERRRRLADVKPWWASVLAPSSRDQAASQGAGRLKTYAANNAIFPHDPTADQWFNEGQFAAYTELGRVLGREVLACANEVLQDRIATASAEALKPNAVAGTDRDSGNVVTIP